MSDRLDRVVAGLEQVKALIERFEDSILDNGELNSYEDEFLEDVKEKLESGRITELTDKQMDLLEQIEFIRAEGRDAWWDIHNSNYNDR